MKKHLYKFLVFTLAFLAFLGAVNVKAGILMIVKGNQSIQQMVLQ